MIGFASPWVFGGALAAAGMAYRREVLQPGGSRPGHGMSERKASFGATLKAVFWSFLGIRKRSDYEKDSASLNPVHVIIAGIIGAGLFIAALVL